MSKSNDDRSRSAPSRLGRGLGSLIPVSIQPPQIKPGAGDNPSVTQRERPTVDAPASGDTSRTAGASERVSAVEPKPATPADQSTYVQFVPTKALRPNRYQPRVSMDAASLDSLAASIAASGLMQPIVVRPVAGDPHVYEVIAGERRWRALERLGHAEAPVIVRSAGNQEAAELALVENLQREDLNPMDRATALRRLTDEFGVTHQQMAERVGLDRATVSNLLRLNDLDAQTAGHVRTGALSAGHAKVLVGIADVARRVSLANQAVHAGWSVRQIEQAAKDDSSVPRGTGRAPSQKGGSAHIARLERGLQEHLGTRVSLRLGRKKGSGELRIQFFSLDEFDGLMHRIGFKDGEHRLGV